MATEVYLQFERVKNLFPFPLATAKLLDDVWMNMQSGVKMFLSAIKLLFNRTFSVEQELRVFGQFNRVVTKHCNLLSVGVTRRLFITALQ